MADTSEDPEPALTAVLLILWSAPWGVISRTLAATVGLITAVVLSVTNFAMRRAI